MTPDPHPALDNGNIWNGQSRRQKFLLLFDFVKTSGVFLTGLALFLTQQSKEDDYKWKRQELALQLLRDWDEKTSDRRNTIDRLQAKLQGVTSAVEMPDISDDLGKQLWAQIGYGEEKVQQERFELRAELISMLNYFESLSVAYSTEAADRDLLVVSVGGQKMAEAPQDLY